MPVFISSEESGDEEDDNGVLRSVLKVKTLRWRSSTVTKFFKKLDEKSLRGKTTRSKRQTLPRVLGNVSERPKPVDEFGSGQFWGFIND